MASIQRLLTFCIPEDARLDSLVTLYLLIRTKQGRQKYPCGETPKIIEWGTGIVCPVAGRTAQDYYLNGFVLINVGGGIFTATDDEPATLLIARDLGLDKHPLYRPLIRAVTEVNLTPPGPLSISSIIRQMYRDKVPAEEVRRWLFHALDSILATQTRFLAAGTEFETNAQMHDCEKDGKHFKIAAIRSDNDQMGATARNKQFAVLIQQLSTGHINIFGNTKMGVKLHRCAGAVRYEELVIGGLENEAEENKSELEQRSQMELVPNWRREPVGENMLNSWEEAPHLPVTRIDPMLFIDLVKDYIEFETQPAEPTPREPAMAGV